ncbi:LSM domain-containing protein [Ditylenchus destructor]|nr:LSM domain-containing protein [Ditylenchus destructor]
MSKRIVTLGNFLKDSPGLHVVIELKDESAVEGTLSSCEAKSLNIELVDTVLYRRRIKNLQPVKADSFFVKGRHIRFIHFDNYPVVLKQLKSCLRKK